jgi:hypothetical protein
MTVFDTPDREFCVVKRSMTNTPLQALTLLNDPIYLETAKKLAERSFHQGGSTAHERLTFMFRLATGRAPNANEMEVLQQTHDKMLSEYRVDGQAASGLIAVGSSTVAPSISVSELAATMLLCRPVASCSQDPDMDSA